MWEGRIVIFLVNALAALETGMIFEYIIEVNMKYFSIVGSIFQLFFMQKLLWASTVRMLVVLKNIVNYHFYLCGISKFVWQNRCHFWNCAV